jgi:dephospho-CoA kinase
MKTFGLTGGIGMGKSTSGDLLRKRGISVIDTDAIARELVEPGLPALVEIQSAFGNDILDAHGRLRRNELARRVFTDSAARRHLEQILHPRIREIWLRQLKTWRGEHRACAVVIIPLLFETSAQSYFDATICLACSEATQKRRLMARGWEQSQIDLRNAAQFPIEKKIELSTYVIWSEAAIDIDAAQLARTIP